MKTFVTILFIAFFVSAIAQTNPLPIQAQSTVDQTSQNDLKLAVMEKELEVSKDFTQHILATVYFCIGTIVVVLFTMVGFGWFQNIRAYERDKEALRQALTATLNEHIAQRIQEVDKKANERFGAFDVKMADALEKHFSNFLSFIFLWSRQSSE